jgi:hypothetical protein
MITRFSTLDVGHIELEHCGLSGTPADDRRYPDERLVCAHIAYSGSSLPPGDRSSSFASIQPTASSKEAWDECLVLLVGGATPDGDGLRREATTEAAGGSRPSPRSGSEIIRAYSPLAWPITSVRRGRAPAASVRG